MKALVWHATNDVRIERVPDPTILNPRDAIVKVTTTAICGSDLHLLDGYIPTMQAGDILGHDPAATIREDLRRFKQLMEAGETPTTAGQPRGRQSILNYD